MANRKSKPPKLPRPKLTDKVIITRQLKHPFRVMVTSMPLVNAREHVKMLDEVRQTAKDRKDPVQPVPLESWILSKQQASSLLKQLAHHVMLGIWD